MTFTPADTANYNTLTQNVNIDVAKRQIGLVFNSLPNTKTFIPILVPQELMSSYGNSAQFNVTASNLVSGDNNVQLNVVENTAGLSLLNSPYLVNGTVVVPALYYNGTATVSVTSGVSVSLGVNNDNYTVSATLSGIKIIDGQASTRPIPIMSNYIHISNTSGFNYYARSANGRSKYYKLMEDVPASALPATWTPIGTSSDPFTGGFDGDGKTITGLTSGMFGYVSGNNMIIKNLGLKSVNITTSTVTVSSTYYVGGVVGYMNSGTVENCYVTGSLNYTSTYSDSAYEGGVVGYMAIGATVQNCYSTANISGSGANYFVGGVVGYMAGGTVQKCYATGSVKNTATSNTVARNAGGVVGFYTGGTLRDCVALNSAITTRHDTNIGRVYTGTGTVSSKNYGRGIGTTAALIDMRHSTGTDGTGGTSYSVTSSDTGKDGETTSTAANNSKNPSVATFWTTAGNWNTAWDTSTIWDTTNVATNGRPLLRGFTAGMQ